MKNTFARGVAAFAVLAALAACNGSNNNSTNPSTPTCALPATFAVVYPVDGSNTVPVSNLYFYIASQSNNLANGNYQAVVQPPNGLPAYVGGNFTQVPLSQIPTPRTLPTFSNAIYYQSNIGGLTAGSTYQIGFNNSATSCSPNLVATFTTQ